MTIKQNLPEDACERLVSLLYLIEDIETGSDAVSYGHVEGETRKFLTVVSDSDYRRQTVDILFEMIEWVNSLPAHPPKETS